MFSQVSVCPQGGGGVLSPTFGGDTQPGGGVLSQEPGGGGYSG